MNKQVKWGILGCGSIANKFAEALNGTPNAIPYAAGSRDISKAKQFSEKWNFKKQYGSYRELVKDPEIDIVYIATPHSYHFAHTKLCLEAGKNVLCEKPFTINSAQLKILLNIAEEKKLFLMEALWSKFLPGIIKVKELIDQGAIGDIIIADIDFGIDFPIDPEHRINHPLLGGGALLDIGIYTVFLNLYMFGKPEKIIATASLDKNKTDQTTSIITENKTGVVTHIYSTIRANTPIKAAFYGTKGSIEFDNWWFTPVDITLKQGERKKILKFPPIVNGYEYEAIEAGNCLNNNLRESDIMPHEFSLLLMEQLDHIRKLTGISYPEEIESTDTPFGWNEL